MRTGSLVLLVLLLVGLRLIHLGADTPVDLRTPSVGPYVDEGYKTLGPRNRVLFGRTHWNPEDQYASWSHSSPLTQGAFELAFRIAGPSLESARFVTLGYFGVLLFAFGMAHLRRYEGHLLLCGLLVIGLQSTLFFYSRIALFEIPMSAFVYGLVLFLARVEVRRWPLACGLTLLVMGILTFGLKQSAVVYLLPVLLVLVCQGIWQRGLRWTPQVGFGIVGFGTVLLMVLFLTRATWMDRLQLSAMAVPARLLANPMLADAPVTAVAGFFCAYHALLCCPARFLQSPYRAALIALVVFAPSILSLFSYDPLRYYVPFLPAHLLLMIEWVHLRAWRESPLRRVSRPWSVVGIAFSILLVCFVFEALNQRWLGRPAYLPGGDLGIAGQVRLRWLIPLAGVLGVGVWFTRHGWGRPRWILLCAAVLAGLFVMFNGYRISRFLVAPTWSIRTIRSELSAQLPAGASIAGDWAPLFALGTSLKALYVSDSINRSSIAPLAPDFFLDCENRNSRLVRAEIDRLRNARLAEPVYRSRYIGRSLTLYPIEFAGR